MDMKMRFLSKCLGLLLVLSLALPCQAAESHDWEVTVEDYFGGNNGKIIKHVVTPTSIVSYQSSETDDEPAKEISRLRLDEKQKSAIIAALNRVDVDSLKDEYRPEKPIFDGTWVGFTFDLQDRNTVKTTVYQGASQSDLKRVVKAMNKILPDEHRIRGMDR